MKINNYIRRFILCGLGMIIVFGAFSFQANAQLAAIDGGNLDFMATTPPSFDGWTAKTGSYSGNSSAPTFTLSTSYNDPSTATFSGDWGGESTKAFVINTNLTEKDEHSLNKLNKIPTHLGYKRSVRLGPISPNNGGGKSAELTYRLKINDSNSLVTFCYAMILLAPHPGEKYANPTFEVDVVEDATDALVKECCFFQNCGDLNTNNLPSGWNKGEGSWDVWLYSDWNQITVNLDEFYGQTVKLRVRISGCTYTAHGGYGYFVASCGKPSINLSGCAGEGDTVTLAEAPRGFSSYEWFEIPTGMTDQYDIDAVYSSDNVVSTDSILAITTLLMDNQDNKSFAVRLTSPTQHVTWDNSPAPACVTYIPADVHDMRPKFDKMHQAKSGTDPVANYIPTSPESDIDEIGFLFNDVAERNNNYPLDWQVFDFGDGDSLEFICSADGHWSVNETATPLQQNHCRVTYSTNSGNPDTVFHTYEHGVYVLTRYAHSYASDPADTLECTKYDTMNVNVPIRPALKLTSVDTVCYNDKVTITASSPGDDATSYTYQWWYANDDTQNTLPFHEGQVLTIEHLQEDLLVQVKVLTADGFYRWARDTVRVQAFPDIQIEGDTMICIGEILHLTATDLSGETLGMKWSYQMPNSQTDIPNTSNVVSFEDAVRQDTTVFIVAQTTNHCVAWKSAKIIVVEPTVTANKKEICVGDEVVLTGSGAVDYSWSSNPTDATLQEDVTGLNPVRVAPTQTTEYTMTGYGQNGCQAKVNITITIVPHPVVKFGFSPDFVDMDEPVVLFIDSSDYSAKSEWTFSDGGRAEGGSVTYEFNVLNVDNVGVHLVTSNRLGCSSEGDTTLAVKLFAVWVPNAFTPDGDGINDHFFFMTKNDLEDVRLEVFDRWGAKLYSFYKDFYQNTGVSDIETYGWDGKYKGKYVQNDVYAWRLTYKRPGNTRIYDRQGTITSVR